MHIYLDNNVFTIQKAGGVSVYWYELVDRLSKSGLQISFLNTCTASENIFEKKLNYAAFDCIKESSISPRLLRYLPLQYKLPSKAVFHAGYLRVSPQKDIVNIMTVHDFAHERGLATRFPRGLANKWQKRYGIKHADGIICVSESTKNDLLYFYPKTDPNKIRVIYHGISNEFFPLTKNYACDYTLPFSLDEKYILYVGGRRFYKNFNLAVDVLKKLSDYKLVVAGGDAMTIEELSLLEENIPGRYVILPQVNPGLLNILYNYAFCLLYPSVYEGFGFPPGEAMKAGCPVVTTNRSSIPEVTGNAGLLVHDVNADSMAAEITKLEDENYRQRIISLGLQQAVRFTWQKCFEETLSFYNERFQNKFL